MSSAAVSLPEMNHPACQRPRPAVSKADRKNVIIGRRIVRSATSARTIAKVLSQPNIRNSGRLENTITISPHERTTDVGINAGPTRMMARLNAGSGAVAQQFFEPQAIEEMNGGAQPQHKRYRERDHTGELKRRFARCFSMAGERPSLIARLASMQSSLARASDKSVGPYLPRVMVSRRPFIR